MADIFISYKREDRPLVEELAKALEADGLSVWWDTDLPLGKNYATAISSELTAAKVVIPVWTARSVQSEWVQEEATVGKNRGSLIPVRLEAVEPPIGFRMIQTADLSNWKPGDTSHPEWHRLSQSLRAMIGGAGSTSQGSASPGAARAPEAVAPVMPAWRPPAGNATRDGAMRGGALRNVVIAAVIVALGAVGGTFFLLNRPERGAPFAGPGPEATASAQPAPAAVPAAEAAPAPEPVPTPEPPAASAAPAAPEPATPEPTVPETTALEPATPEPATAAAEPAAPVPGKTREISYATAQGIGVNDFAFAPNGKTAISAGNDGTVRLLDAASGKELKRFDGLGPRILQAVYSRTGSHVVISASDSSVAMVEIASGKTAGRFKTPGDLRKMAVAPDDGSIATLDSRNQVHVYQADGVLLRDIPGKPNRNVYGIAWCPQSDCLLLWGKDGLLEVWDPFKPELVDALRGHKGAVRAAAFSADGQRFATVADDRQVLLWDANSGKRIGALAGLTESPLALAWSRDGRRIAVETDSGKAFVWAARAGAPVIVGPKKGLRTRWLAFTPDGKSVVLASGGDGPTAVRIPE